MRGGSRNHLKNDLQIGHSKKMLENQKRPHSLRGYKEQERREV